MVNFLKYAMKRFKLFSMIRFVKLDFGRRLIKVVINNILTFGEFQKSLRACSLKISEPWDGVFLRNKL